MSIQQQKSRSDDHSSRNDRYSTPRSESRSANSPSRGRQSADDQAGMDNDLNALFLDELADLLDAEEQLTKALPKLAEAAKSEELAAAFESHLSETQNHVSRLESVFQSLGKRAHGKKCKAMEGLVKEGKELIEEMEDTAALDAALIAAAQKVEHYEIASYGAVRAWAEQMGHTEALELLNQTLSEEKAADQKLTEIAENSANREAESTI